MSNVGKIDIHKKSDAVQGGYFNEAITVVNDHVIRVSVMTTSYPWPSDYLHRSAVSITP